MHWAVASCKNLTLIEALIARAPAAVKMGDEAQNTPLHTAAGVGNVAVITALLNAGADPNVVNENGALPLHYAKGRVATLELLLPATRNVDAKDAAGLTAVARASALGQSAAAATLIAAGASVNEPNHGGETPLHLAAEGGHEAVTSLLIQAGADVHAVDGEGRRPGDVGPPAARALIMARAQRPSERGAC